MGDDRLFSKVSRVTESPMVRSAMWGMALVRTLQKPKGLPRVSRGQRRAGVGREGTVAALESNPAHTTVSSGEEQPIQSSKSR
jgi:hypothetical protein